MFRARLAALATITVSNLAWAEDLNWQPVAGTPPPAVIVAPTPAPAVAPSPATTPVKSAISEQPNWTTVSMPAPRPVAPVTPSVALSAPSTPTPTLALPVPTREILPTQVPLLAVPDPRVSQDEKPEVPPPPKPVSEPLPAPRPTKPETPAAAATPPTPSSTYTVTPAAALCQPDLRPALEPAPGLPGATAVPSRGKTFGSPPIRLSRDYNVHEFFGTDLDSTRGVPAVAALANGVLSPGDFFVEAEYLLWWANRPRIPLLATTANGTGLGFVGQPGTIPLLGPGTFGPTWRDGMRVRVGGWLDENQGFDASFFFLGRRTESQTFAGFPTLTRPIFAPNFDAEFGEVVALPNLSTGRFTVDADSFLWGADVNYRCATCRTCDRTNAWFVGYRHLNLSETLTMTEFITASGPLATDPIGTEVVVQDRFRTSNRFHGAQVGWMTSRRSGNWELDVRASVALGVTSQILEIDAFQNRTRPGQRTETFRGGLLATGPNLGRFTSSRFSVVPEATVTLGYAVTPRLRLSVGYNFLYWNNVIRPGDQIDRVADVSLVPNPPAGVPASGQNRPQPLFRQSDIWVQGISLGAMLRW